MTLRSPSARDLPYPVKMRGTRGRTYNCTSLAELFSPEALKVTKSRCWSIMVYWVPGDGSGAL